MPTHEITVSCPVPNGFAVDQVRGMFDLAPAKTASETFAVDVPDDDELIDQGNGEMARWRIGVIVGPSGSGKTTVARDVYGDRFCEGGFPWDQSRAMCDHFDGHAMKTVAQTFNAVGFSSPPSWLKPHHVLSGGERFRCDLARALLGDARRGAGGEGRGCSDLIAFDEFTSVVDRTVAKVGSAAVARGIRHNRFGERKQFVAVTCHYDVLDWLEPDWVLDMSSQQLARGRLRCVPGSKGRPPINLTIAPIGRSAWGLFRRHHYLNTALATGAKCFAAFWPITEQHWEIVAFSAWMHAMHRNRRPGDMREHRTVVLPDYQGIGIGNRVSEACASMWTALGGRATSTTSSPSMIHYRHASPLWRTSRFGMIHPPRGGVLEDKVRRGQTRPFNSCKRVTGSFRYVGPPMPRDLAERMAHEYPHGQTLRVLTSLGATTAQRVAAHMDYSPSAVAQSLDAMADQGRVRRFRIGRNRWGYEAV